MALYTNRLSAKEADNVALQTAIKKLEGEVKNLNAEVASFKKSVHSVSVGSANKYNSRMAPKFKIEGQDHHPTWWSTTYCWSHGAGGHADI